MIGDAGTRVVVMSAADLERVIAWGYFFGQNAVCSVTEAAESFRLLERLEDQTDDPLAS